MPRGPNYKKPLPTCDGPKLQPFKDGTTAIKFHSLISSQSNPGGHSHVFEVSIGVRIYALKVFRFYHDSQDVANLADEEKEVVPIKIVHAHMDPFYNECRAYGKLIEKDLNGKVAVHCFGFLTLPAKIEAELDRRFGPLNWDRLSDDAYKPVSERKPLRAIVKELIRDVTPFTARNASKMLRNLKSIRQQGIFPYDIAVRNYRAGVLIDFSLAMTEPHYIFDTREDWEVSFRQSKDLFDFDKMIEDANVKTWVRATPNQSYLEKLRPRLKESEASDR